MQYSEFNTKPTCLKLKCILCGLPKDNHTAYHIFTLGNEFNLNPKIVPSQLTETQIYNFIKNKSLKCYPFNIVLKYYPNAVITQDGSCYYFNKINGWYLINFLNKIIKNIGKTPIILEISK